MGKVFWVFLFQLLSIACFILSMFQVGEAGGLQSRLMLLGMILIIPGVGASNCLDSLRGIPFKVMDFIFGITVTVNILAAIVGIAMSIAGSEKYSQSMEQTYEIPLSTHGWNQEEKP